MISTVKTMIDNLNNDWSDPAEKLSQIFWHYIACMLIHIYDPNNLVMFSGFDIQVDTIIGRFCSTESKIEAS